MLQKADTQINLSMFILVTCCLRKCLHDPTFAVKMLVQTYSVQGGYSLLFHTGEVRVNIWGLRFYKNMIVILVILDVDIVYYICKLGTNVGRKD